MRIAHPSLTATCSFFWKLFIAVRRVFPNMSFQHFLETRVSKLLLNYITQYETCVLTRKMYLFLNVSTITLMFPLDFFENKQFFWETYIQAYFNNVSLCVAKIFADVNQKECICWRYTIFLFMLFFVKVKKKEELVLTHWNAFYTHCFGQDIIETLVLVGWPAVFVVKFSVDNS